MKSTELRIRNLYVSYEKRDIIRDVSLVFQPGLNYLIGLNGSGKSSLLHALNGLLPYRGDIFIDKLKLQQLKARDRAKQMSLLSQQVYLPFPIQVYDFVLMGRFPHLSWLNTYTPADHEAAQHALAQLKISDFRHRKLNELSGGEFQRVNLAKALCQGSPILLLDEPAQSLDPKGKAYLYRLIADIAEDHLVICATHDIEYIQPSHRVLGLKDGEIVCDGAVEEWASVKKLVYGM